MTRTFGCGVPAGKESLIKSRWVAQYESEAERLLSV